MSFYTPELIQKVKQIDLLTYLKNYDPDELVPYSRNTYTTREHDSLKISNGKWFWFSKGFGGYNALDYLMKVKDYSFMDAMDLLLGNVKIKEPINYFVENKRKIDRLILPEKNDNNDKVKSYLMGRGIDEEIIEKCIEKGLIYETKYKNNVVFVGYDEYKNPRYGGIRGTNNTRFMMDASGSDKEFSFRMLSKTISDKVHIFESAIDLLSFATLMKMNNKDWENTNLIALAGVYQPAKDVSQSKVPSSVKSYLEKHKNIKRIFVHFDADNAGRLATQVIKNNLSDKYEIIDAVPNIGKDWNDYLMARIEKEELKKKQNIKER